MVISRTPFRISFFGGGTDYPAWYRQHGGAVLAATINKYCYLTARHLPPFFEHRIRVVYSKIEDCQTADQISHPAVRAILQHLKIDRSVEIHHDGDLPGRSGMGSSSAFTVGLLQALLALNGRMAGKEQLARESIHVEQEIIKEAVGSQDQVCAAYGGLNFIEFARNGEVTVRPMTLQPARVKELNAHLMLFYTGIKRTAADLVSTYLANFEAKANLLHQMRRYVDQSCEILTGGGNLTPFGELLDSAWQAKRSLGDKVSNSRIDELYATALEQGALGGKLLGAGGGGFLLFFVPPEKQARVKKALNRLIHVPFEFEFSGSQIIFYDPGEDYEEQDRARARQQVDAFHELTPGRQKD